MICIIHDGLREKRYALNKGFHCIQFFETSIELDINEARKFNLNDLSITILNDNQYNYFKKYELQDEISIGSSDVASIQVLNSHIERIHCVINLKNKIIEKPSCIFINGQMKKHFNANDLLTLNELKILITDNFVMVNQCESIRVHLEQIKIKNYSIQLVNNKRGIFSQKRPYSIKPTCTLELQSFNEVHAIEKLPLFFSLFPILMMSCASLLSGSIMAYQGYLQGRELIEVLPSLIVPLVMIMSSFFIHPLQRLYENKKYKKKVTILIAEINQYYQSIEEVIKLFNSQLLDYERVMYRTSRQIIDDFEHKNKYIQNIEGDEIIIPLGKGTILSGIQFKNFPKENNIAYKQYIEISNKYMFLQHHLVTINIVEYRNICTNSMQCFLWICFYLTTQVSSNNLSLIFICDIAWLSKYIHCTLFEHSVYQDKHYVYSSISEFKENDFVEDHRIKIVLNITGESFRSENTCVHLLHSNLVPTFSDCQILLDNNKGKLKTTQNEINFLFEDIETDFQKLFERIHFYQSKQDKKQPSTGINLNQLAQLNLVKNWENNTTINSLAVNIGFDIEGKPLELDLHESKDGPHLLVGATTGAGKSESIITLCIMLMLKYSYQDFQFVVVDFKGGGLANSFYYNGVACPHFIGSISNLDSHEILRFFSAIKIESRRRQVLFNQMAVLSNTSSVDIKKYQLQCDQLQLEKLSHLFVIIDEFAELKVEYEDFIKELISLARIGRSLGIHLILSTQKPSNVVDGQIWSNCRTRISLRVQDKQDSLEMIDSNLAFYLDKPGQFYKYTDNILTKGEFYYLNSSFDNANSIAVYDLYHRKFKLNKKSHESILSKILEKLTSQSYKPQMLWNQPLERIEKEALRWVNRGIGIIDDIETNSQVPCIVDLVHTLFYVKNQNELLNWILTLLYAYLKMDEPIEIYILDYEKIFSALANSTSFIHSISSDELLLNLLKDLSFKKNQDKIDLFIAPSNHFLIEKMNLFEIEFHRFLNDGFNKNIFLNLFTYTANAIPYTTAGYFQTKIVSSSFSRQDLSIIFEEKVRYGIHKEDFYYIQKEKISYFRKLNVTFEDIIEKKPKLSKKKIICEMPEIVIGKKEGRIGISYETYQWIDLQQFPFCFLVAKTSSILLQFIRKCIPSYHRVWNEAELYEARKSVVFVKDLDKVDSLSLKKSLNQRKHPLVFCLDVQSSSQTWIKEIMEDEYILWVGDGLSDQYIIAVNRKIKCDRNQGYYVHHEKREKVRLIDELFNCD